MHGGVGFDVLGDGGGLDSGIKGRSERSKMEHVSIEIVNGWTLLDGFNDFLGTRRDPVSPWKTVRTGRWTSEAVDALAGTSESRGWLS